MILILLISLAWAAPPAVVHEPSVAEKILHQPAKTSLQGLSPLLPLIRATIEKQGSFERGEFNQSLQQRVSEEFHSSTARLEKLAGSQITAWLKQEGHIWWLFLERLSFEEVSKPALDFSWQLRREIITGMQKKAVEKQPDFPKVEVLTWVSQLEFRPPLDRLLVLEARNQRIDASRLINLLQKNPFRSIRESRSKLPPRISKSLEKLDSLWTDENAQFLRDTRAEFEALKASVSRP